MIYPEQELQKEIITRPMDALNDFRYPEMIGECASALDSHFFAAH